LIDRRELLAKARHRRLPLGMIEKDYVLGWVLYGLMQIPDLVFKGGTALSKVYFPETWRLSEDLDFVITLDKWEELRELIPRKLKKLTEKSGIQLVIKSTHSNPGYMQYKIQYTGPLGKNWIKVDITPETPIGEVLSKPLSQTYSDYPNFTVRVESPEEIFAQKLRALIERKKVRDYYDVWRLCNLHLDRTVITRLFREKLKVKEIEWDGLVGIFPDNIDELLKGYWERELGRLVQPVPDMETVLEKLKQELQWLES